MNKNFIVPIFTALGALAGALIWLISYDLNHTPSIGFDGPAGVMLYLSLITGGSIFGILSIIYVIRKKHTSFLKAALVFLVSNLVACVLVGMVITKYSMSKYPQRCAWSNECIPAKNGRGALSN